MQTKSIYVCYSMYRHSRMTYCDIIFKNDGGFSLMILKRKSVVNIFDMQRKYGDLFKDSPVEQPVESFYKLIQMQQVYSGAMEEICTKLEILDDEFQIMHKHNPIHHMECRLKKPDSIMRKMMDRGIHEFDISKAGDEIYDIAGIRVICNYLEDIYTIEKLLLKQSDVVLLERKDYVKSPKPSGYRSLHLIVTVPVFLSESTRIIPVEIQIRTIAMDLWASLEHKLKYKNESDEVEKYKNELTAAADKLSEIEQTLQHIHKQIL